MRNYLFRFVLTSLIILQCGKSSLEKAEISFNNGHFGEAIEYYLEILTKQPDNAAIREKLCLSYLKEGEKIYNTRKVIRAFEARIETAKKYVPEEPSPQIKNHLSEAYYQLALAYKNSIPENPYQKKIYFDNTLKYLEMSLFYDENNNESKTALLNYKQEHFQDIYEKGLAYYQKGSIDESNYILADHYLSIANSIDPKAAEVENYLNLARKKALNILDLSQQVPIAITAISRKEQYLAFYIALQNVDIKNLAFGPQNFILIGDDNTEVKGEGVEIFESYLQPVNLLPGEETEGVVAFKISGNKNLYRLEFRINDELLGFKNLPG